ncbi:MAG: SusC/RagA family TonB-linked outer membrane protein [Breznakibacter sp.]
MEEFICLKKLKWLRDSVFYLTRRCALALSLTIASSQAIGSGFGQNRLTLSLENVSLEEAIRDVKNNIGFGVLYKTEDVRSAGNVTMSVYNAKTEEVMDRLLAGTGLDYAIRDEVIVIKKNDPSDNVQQDPVSLIITGQVLDGANKPLPGVTVLIKGTSIGAVTDMSGNYSIKVSDREAILVFTFIGMKSQEQALNNRTTINVVLAEDVSMIGEVVVTTGMTRMDKRLFTGATDQLKTEDVKIDGLSEISRALEGRSAGVSVQNVSGTFGTAPKIRVRGATSIYGSSKPLWVVDGVVMEDVTEVDSDDLSSGDAITLISSAIAGLNAEDIESFQILKDGSATSIYGARAMAGVIVVTTKKGKAGVSRFNYTGEYTYRQKPSYANFNIMNSQEQMGVYKEMQEKGWLNFADVYRASNSGVYGKMYQLINTYDPTTGTFALMNTTEAKNQYLRAAEMRNTDWFDELFNSNVVQNHSISMTSGTEKSNSYVSLSVLSDPGWSKQSSVNRYTANLNSTYNITKTFSANVLANASYRKQKAPGTLSQSVDVVNGEVKRDFDINPYSYALNTSRTLDTDVMYTRNYADFNIANELKNNYMDLNVVDIKYQTEFKWKLFKELELSALGALKYQTTSQEHKIKDESNQALAYRAMSDATIRDKNSFLYTDPDVAYSLPISVLPEGGIYQRTDYKMFGYDFRTTATWNHVFNDVHITNFFGGMEASATDRGKTWFNGWGLQYSLGETPYYIYEFFKKSIEEGTDYYSITNSKNRNTAFFGTGTYSYKGKYVLNGTVRYEGSNKLGKSRSARWLPTWNVAGAWNMHEESFFEELNPVLSHFTLKASYSLTADRGPNNVTNSLAVIKSYTPYRPFTNVQESGLEVSDLENSELTYEKKHELNIGADLGFLNNRINLSTDWYTRNNFDLIGPVITQGVGGQTQKLANTADMKSHGIEFTLSTKNIVTDNFDWTSNLIFSQNKNKVTKLESDSRVIDLITGTGFAREGYPVRGLFSIPFMGLDENGIPTFLDQDGNVTSTGIYFQERDNLDFLKYEGPSDPTVNGSFGNISRYKNLRLNVFVTYSFGNKVQLDPVFKSYYSDLTATPKEFKNRWTLPGDELKTDIPVILSKRQYDADNDLKYAYNAYNYSDVRIADGGFIRMKEISLSYEFPKQMIERLNINNLSLKVQGTNLFLLYADSKLNGQDPEFFRSGGVSAPVPKQFTFTLRLGI